MTLNTLNPIKFAVLISYLSDTEWDCVGEDRMTAIYNLVRDCLPQPQITHSTTLEGAQYYAFQDFLEALKENRKIDAIKLHRTLTGYGLKESKDVVDAVYTALSGY